MTVEEQQRGRMCSANSKSFIFGQYFAFSFIVNEFRFKCEASSVYKTDAHIHLTHITNLESRSSAMAERSFSPHIAFSVSTSFNPLEVSVSDVTAPSTMPINSSLTHQH